MSAAFPSSNTNHFPVAEPQDQPFELLQGINSVTLKEKSTCMSGTKTGPHDFHRSATIQYTKTIQELQQALAVGVNASGSGDSFSASGSASFYELLHVTDLSVVVVIVGQASNIWNLNNCNLDTKVTKRPANIAELNTFVSKYGDCFLSSITIGSAFYGCAVYDCVSTAQQTQVEAALQAANLSGSASGGADVNFSQIAQTTQVRLTLTCDTYGSSPVVDVPLPSSTSSVQEAWNYAVAFTNAINQNDPGNFLFSSGLTGYESEFGAVFQPVVDNRKLFLSAKGYIESYDKCSDTIATINQLLDIQYFYNPAYVDPTLKPNGQALCDSQASILITRDAWNAAAANALPVPTVQNFGNPSLDIEVSQQGPAGTNVSNPFPPAMDPLAFVNARCYFSAFVGSWTDHGVTSFGYTITSSSTNLSCASPTYGKGGGSGNNCVVPVGIQVIRISGAAGQDFNSLKIQFTNMPDWNIGTSGGNGFNFPLTYDDKGLLCGFFGQSGDRPDQLGVQSFRFRPCSWTS